MSYQKDHKIIIAYRLEDMCGNSSFCYNGHKVILPEGYYGAVLDPTRYKEKDYKYSFYKLSLFEYILYTSALVYESGEVLFRKEDIISKTLVRR